MAQIQCFHCRARWDLATADTNRCPRCGWVQEIYYDEAEAAHVVKVYNEEGPPLPEPAGFCPLIGTPGYSVSFPDQRRLARVAERLLSRPRGS